MPQALVFRLWPGMQLPKQMDLATDRNIYAQSVSPYTLLRQLLAVPVGKRRPFLDLHYYNLPLMGRVHAIPSLVD